MISISGILRQDCPSIWLEANKRCAELCFAPWFGFCLELVRLIGDLDHPDQHVGIGLADLLSHSLWAQVS